MTYAETLARTHLAPAEQIAAILDEARVKIVSQYLPACPDRFKGELQDVIAGLADLRGDYTGGVIRELQNEISDIETDEGMAEIAERRRDYHRSVL
jgi:hypothetical protein